MDIFEIDNKISELEKRLKKLKKKKHKSEVIEMESGLMVGKLYGQPFIFHISEYNIYSQARNNSKPYDSSLTILENLRDDDYWGY